ncbi:Alpha/Beta hydrolase protein [Aspergillus pseudonomiae]|uniref:Alpha/Beta hydrolase protein n=1 Tax=Aspergillus pseudonomiae TaxID=1506151 RepID=A0A5N7DUB8_9EURO|nr:Alpha/Beta hydrolase protein [Aspergillus pseudonomiae]KAB8261335.1 Alpha/Beta hydrolase protein [Aspergillus pseudonomiae]KAE8410070.1 Alpha/Beta hydrolase protein [Aspergillus pseudonomiae]
MPPKRTLKYHLFLKPVALVLRALAYTLAPRITPTPTTTLHIPSRDPQRTIPVHIYRPRNPAKGPHPVLLNFCGGGFIIQGHGLDHTYCSHIAAHTAYTVFDVQYRMAPEHPFPAALEDAEDVLGYVRARPETYDASRVALSGFSAGGNLATSLAANHEGPFKVLVAFYPLVDAVRPLGERKAPERGGWTLPGWFVRFCTVAYLSGGFEGQGGDVRISPLRRAVADGWRVERVLLVAAARDLFAPEVEELGALLAKGGNGGFLKKVVVERVDGVGHAWDKVAKEGTVGWEKMMRVYGMVVDLLD